MKRNHRHLREIAEFGGTFVVKVPCKAGARGWTTIDELTIDQATVILAALGEQGYPIAGNGAPDFANSWDEPAPVRGEERDRVIWQAARYWAEFASHHISYVSLGDCRGFCPRVVQYDQPGSMNPCQNASLTFGPAADRGDQCDSHGYMRRHTRKLLLVRAATITAGELLSASGTAPVGGGNAVVEVDEPLVGGRTRGKGKGVHGKIYVLGAVECRQRKQGEAMAADGLLSHRSGKPLKRQTYAGRLRLQVSSDRRAATCEGFVGDNILPGSLVRTDGWHGYDGLMGRGYRHDGLTLDGDSALAESHLPMIHLVFSNLKTWILGTHHGTSQQHLQAYLNEYTFRFNRRFYPMTAFNSVLGIAAKTVPPTYEALYSGEWQHPGSQPTSPQIAMPFA